jgi:hypothetical protein
MGVGKAGVAIKVPSRWLSGNGTYVDELRAHLVGRNGLQLGQLLLIAHRPHQGEAVPMGEEGLDRLPNLHITEGFMQATAFLKQVRQSSRR